MKRFLPLFLGAMAIGMAEFALSGVITQISSNLNVGIVDAGRLMTIYALGVVVGAPLVIVLSNKLSLKKSIIFLLSSFVICNALIALSDDFYAIFMIRFLSGLPHGSFFGVGAIIARKMATKGKEGHAMSILFAGFTVSAIIGTPLGIVMSDIFSWRSLFYAITVLSMAAVIFAILLLKDEYEEPKKVSILSFLKKKQNVLLVFIVAAGTTGFFSCLTYIEPILILESGLSHSMIPAIISIIGLGMFFGNFLGGWLTDNFNKRRIISVIFFIMIVDLLFIFVFSHLYICVIFLAFINGMLAFALVIPLQSLMIEAANKCDVLAASICQGSQNIGNILGSFLGGFPILWGHFSYSASIFPGIIMILLALVLLKKLSFNE